MKRSTVLLLALLLALASLFYARERYITKNSFLFKNPINTRQAARLSNPFMDDSLVGTWMKDQWLFAIAIPGVLIAGGLVLAAKK